MQMANMHLSGITLDYPVLSHASRRLSRQLIRVATGGSLDRAESGRVTVRALDGVSATFADGDRIGLVGHNGSGKTTLLRVLAGIYEPTQGRLDVQGRVGSLIDIALGMSGEASGRENIYLRGALQGLSRKRITELMPEIVDFTELGDFIDLPMRTYSSGMLLRLAFSVATSLAPDILLMDEWLSVGDESFQMRAERRLTEVVEQTSILVVATHSEKLIRDQCNRVIHMDQGRVIADGTPDDVLPGYFNSRPRT